MRMWYCGIMTCNINLVAVLCFSYLHQYHNWSICHRNFTDASLWHASACRVLYSQLGSHICIFVHEKSYWHFWPFVRKDLCEARAKPRSVFKFSDNLSALSQMYPPRWGFRSGWHLVRLQVRLTLGQMYPPRMRFQVRLTFGQT